MSKYTDTELTTRLAIVDKFAKGLLVPLNTRCRVDWNERFQAACVEMVREMAYVPGKERLVIRQPRSWWQMLKHEQAPRWFKRRFPVKWRDKRYEARAYFPELALPGVAEQPVHRWKQIDAEVEY